jgi:hypothetical protein
MIMKPTVVLILLAGFVGCSEKQSVVTSDAKADRVATSDAAPRCDEIARRYEQLTLITKEPVEVDPYLATYCVSAEVFAKAAKARSGPHAGAAVRIFMNAEAAKAFRSGGNAYPVGAVIVKEKQRLEPEGNALEAGDTLFGADGVGGMIKRPAGYDPEHGNWEYFYFEDPTKVEHGKIVSCVECHRSASATDFVFGGWAGER